MSNLPGEQQDTDLGSKSGRSSGNLNMSKKQQATTKVELDLNLGPATILPAPVLTTHELYELNQQQAQLEQTGQFMLPLGQQTSMSRQTSPSASFRNSIHSQHRALERQQSVIVGTAGFRQKYGE